jgi:hypothetical protein
MSEFSVYRFLNKDDETIYIGRTNNLKRRLELDHFTKHGHLDQECYDQTERIEFMNLISEGEMKIYETYLINKYNPIYNKVEKRGDTFTFELKEYWHEYQFNKADLLTDNDIQLYNHIQYMAQANFKDVTITDFPLLLNGTGWETPSKPIRGKNKLEKSLLSLENKGYIQIYKSKDTLKKSVLTIMHGLKELKL